MASKQENSPHQGLSTFTEDIKIYSSKLESGEYSAASKLVGVIDEVVLVVRNDDNINLTQVSEIIDCLRNVVKYLVEERDKLQESHDKLQESHDKLQESHDKLQESHDKLQESRDKLQKRVKELEDRLKHLENLEEILLVGQVASKVEKVFIGEVVKGTNITKTRYLSIGQLVKALSDRAWDPLKSKSIFKSQEDVLKAKENLDGLETTFQPDYELYCAIKELKVRRNPIAHPGMTVTQARERLVNCHDRDIVYRLLDILDRAKVQNIET